MAASKFQIEPLPIIGPYNIQRFKQFSPEDSANFYIVPGDNTKRPAALFPTMGRQHINYLGLNKLQFSIEPRAVFSSIHFWYAVVGNAIYKIDAFYNMVEITGGTLLSDNGNIYFAYLVVNTRVFACFVDSQKIYVYEEDLGLFHVVTDPNAPGNSTVDGKSTRPGFIAAFGNRITVSVANSSQFFLSVINLLNPDGSFDPAHCFSIGYNPIGPVPGAAVFAQEAGTIQQMGVLNNTLYIFCDFTTGIWANIPAIFSGTGVTFPWKKNATYDWNFGLADPESLDINFGRMTFLARNAKGLLQVMSSMGDKPERISTKAIDVLFQKYANHLSQDSPFLQGNANGFLYQFENTIFYRLSAGRYFDHGILDREEAANSIEFNFEAKEWHRCIELNGERNRIQKHVFFNNTHLVTVLGEGTIYEMNGAFYTNEVRNANQPDLQSVDTYLQYPFRYERVTPIISEDDYSEFETEYVEIDFVFGHSNISFSTAPFADAQFLIDEQPASDGSPVYLIDETDIGPEPVFLIAEEGNNPTLSSSTYNQILKPHVELYFSDDGGVSFDQADILQFSQMGYYQWRMRWYQLATSRNRVYKLICVSPVPMVILGGVMNVRRSSGGGN